MLSDLDRIDQDFHEEFDTIPEAKKICHTSSTWEQLVLPGTCLGMAFEGTTYGYGESLFNKWGMQAPDLPRHALWRIYTKS
jgi:hypothetical protein